MKTNQGISSFKGLTAVGLCLAIAGFAVYSMASAGTFFAPDGDTAQLQASHDPLQNGLRIQQPRHENPSRLTRTDANEPTVVLLDDWTYTGGPFGS